MTALLVYLEILLVNWSCGIGNFTVAELSGFVVVPTDSQTVFMLVEHYHSFPVYNTDIQTLFNILNSTCGWVIYTCVDISDMQISVSQIRPDCVIFISPFIFFTLLLFTFKFSQEMFTIVKSIKDLV